MDYYASGALNPEVHGRIVADIENFALDANIQPRWIATPLAGVVSPAEMMWVRRFRFHAGTGKAGLVVLGKADDIPLRFAAMAGALVRNFIRARVLTQQAIIDLMTEDGVPPISCVLCPNFYAGNQALQEWRVGLLLDFLIQRHLRGLQTVIYVSDWVAMRKAFGPAMAQHLEATFIATEVGA